MIGNYFPTWDDNLVVWDPITGNHRELPRLPGHLFTQLERGWTAAVLCAAAGGGCDHLDCHDGPFRVVLVCTCCSEMFTCVYSSEAGVWTELTSAPLRRAWVSVHLENALYFMTDYRSSKVLKHDLGTRETSVIRLSRTPYKHIALMTTMDGGLGFSAVHESKLYLWSKVASHEGYVGWAQSQAIELETVLPVHTPSLCDVVYFIDGIAAIFLGMYGELVAVDLRSDQVKRIYYEGCAVHAIVPYTSFYIPAPGVAASTGGGPSTVSSSA